MQFNLESKKKKNDEITLSHIIFALQIPEAFQFALMASHFLSYELNKPD